MAKTPQVYENLDEFVRLLEDIDRKLSSARVLNGGFDKLESEVNEIKKIQLRLLVDFENSKNNIERMDSKIDKIFDPTDGFYPKINKAETMLHNLNEKIALLSTTDEKFFNKISVLEKVSEQNQKELLEIKKVTGDDNEALRKSIKISSGVWWLIAMTTTGLLGAIGKLIWDSFLQP